MAAISARRINLACPSVLQISVTGNSVKKDMLTNMEKLELL